MERRRALGALGRLIATAGAILTLLLGAVPGYGQTAAPAPKPGVREARIAVQMGQDGADTVEATYTVVNTAGLKDGVVDHALVRRPGAEVADVQASGAATGPPTVEPREGLGSVRVTVSGEPATYTLRYTVRRSPGVYAVPVLSPRIPVTRSAPDVTIETTLPPGTRLEGEWFPAIHGVETRDGRTVLVHRVINIPSVTIAEYDRGGLLTPSQWTTLLGLLFLAVVFVWWFSDALPKRRAAPGLR
ncbi:MAG: hypothetical protein ACREMB_10510 [Candidatus Rokuibacteriota bacterium]